MNRWGIPSWLEREVRERDQLCIYCRVEMVTTAPRGASRKAIATWEHIVNDASIVTRQNIALCCNACNASKGAKELAEWLTSQYCRRKGINADTVADVVKRALTNT